MLASASSAPERPSVRSTSSHGPEAGAPARCCERRQWRRRETGVIARRGVYLISRDRRACYTMCSPLGVRTSFACRLPFERPLAAVRELEVDAGIRISSCEPANRRTGEPANRRTGEPANRRTGEPAGELLPSLDPVVRWHLLLPGPAVSRTISIWRQDMGIPIRRGVSGGCHLTPVVSGSVQRSRGGLTLRKAEHSQSVRSEGISAIPRP